MNKKAFTLAETQKNISLATYRGRGIKGEGVIKHPAFTLAETLIVLVILGVIASITIPAVVRNQIEAQNRTRIKKAMTVYDTAINKMVVENGLKSDNALYSSDPNDNRAFAPQDNCTRSSAYFKINRTLNDDNGTNCRFCSSDNVCWDISNILKPIIGIGEEGITNENSSNRYRMFAHFGDNGELRVDDLAYEEQHDYLTDAEKEELVVLYNFANNKKSTGETNKPTLADKCKSGEITCAKKTLATTEINKDFTGGELCIWDNEKNKEICSYTSKAESGEYYFTEPATYDDYQSYLDPDSSNCGDYCRYGDGDYYNAAKRYCADQGGRLPTIAELIAGGYTNENFWAAEERFQTGAYYIYGSSGASDCSKYQNNKVVCIGN